MSARRSVVLRCDDERCEDILTIFDTTSIVRARTKAMNRGWRNIREAGSTKVRDYCLYHRYDKGIK